MKLSYARAYILDHGCRDVGYLRLLGTSIMREAIRIVLSRKSAEKSDIEAALAVRAKMYGMK